MILVANKTKEGRIFYSRIFYNLGLSVGSCTLGRAKDYIDKYKVDAVVLTDACQYHRVHLMCRDFKIQFPNVPLIVIAKDEDEKTLDKIIEFADNIILKGTPVKKIADIIFEYIKAYSKKDITDVIVGGLRVLYYKKSFYVFGEKINPTKTEYSILRYFVDAYPLCVTVDEIRKFCFKPGTVSSETNVTSFIHTINKKSQDSFGKKMIKSKHDKSYELCI